MFFNEDSQIFKNRPAVGYDGICCCWSHQPALFQLTYFFIIMFISRIPDETLHYPWLCREMIFRVAKNYLNMNFNKKKKTFLNRLATSWNYSATPSLRTTALREHSTLSFYKHYGNVTFECFLNILKQIVTFKCVFRRPDNFEWTFY